MSFTGIRSEGDLEVVLLHETHGALARIIGPELYFIGGTPPEQTIMFHNGPSFDLFLVLIVEFLAEAKGNVYINGSYQNHSILSALKWFCEIHENEAKDAGLDISLANLSEWVDRDVPFSFWCPAINQQIEITLSNRHLVNFGANATKHHLLRLPQLLSKLESLCRAANYNLTSQEIIGVMEPMIDETNSRLRYHSTYLVELLGNLFLSINKIITNRFAVNPTNIVEEMHFPSGVTSDIFRDLYGSVLVFMRYPESRITDYTPVTTQYLKLRYQ